MLVEDTLFGRIDKVATAIELLRKYEPKEGYFLAFSGGKDSVCIHELADMAGVKFDAHFNRAMEPPEVIWFIRKYYPNVQTHLPKKTIWKLIIENGIPPLRTIPYCCRILKEGGGNNRVKLTGIRWAESTRRKQRQEVEENRNGGTMIHPIIKWSDQDVWSFIDRYDLPYCKLYDEGWTRIGCVMCPNSGQLKRDAKRWPKIAEAYLRACERAYDPEVCYSWKNGDDMYEWWISGKGSDNEDQTKMFE